MARDRLVERLGQRSEQFLLGLEHGSILEAACKPDLRPLFRASR